MRTVYWVWSMILFASIIVQIGFAGYGAFYAANKLDDEGSTIDDEMFMDGFGLHVGLGLPRHPLRADLHDHRSHRRHREVAPRDGTASCSCLLFIQLWLAWIGFELPFPVGFLHPINAFLIAGLCGWIVWDETQRRRGAPVPAPAT